MDKTAQLTILSTETPLFMDSPRFRWRERCLTHPTIVFRLQSPTKARQAAEILISFVGMVF